MVLPRSRPSRHVYITVRASWWWTPHAATIWRTSAPEGRRGSRHAGAATTKVTPTSSPSPSLITTAFSAVALSLSDVIDIPLASGFDFLSAFGFFGRFLGVNLPVTLISYLKPLPLEHTYLFLYQFQLLGLQQLLRHPLRVGLSAQAEIPQLFAELRSVFVQKAGQSDLHLFDVGLSIGG